MHKDPASTAITGWLFCPVPRVARICPCGQVRRGEISSNLRLILSLAAAPISFGLFYSCFQSVSSELPIISFQHHTEEVSLLLPHPPAPRLHSRPVKRHRQIVNQCPRSLDGKARISPVLSKRIKVRVTRQRSTARGKTRKVRGSSTATHKLTFRGLTYAHKHTMFSSTLLALISAATLSSAHTILTYPGWRGDNLITNETFPYGMQWMYPCELPRPGLLLGPSILAVVTLAQT